MSFYMNMFTEGEQADRYKERKEREREEARRKEDERNDRRYVEDKGLFHKTRTYRPSNSSENTNRATRQINKEIDSRYNKKSMPNLSGIARKRENELNNFKNNLHIASDATYRHARRHPEQYKECGIFESVQFLDEDLF